MPPTMNWDLDPSRWDALVAADPAASVFHTPAWYRAHAAALGYQPMAAWLRFGSGREAVLPLAVKGRFRGLVRTAHAGVEGGYGGLIAPEALAPDEAAWAWKAVRRRFPDLVAAGNPFAPDRPLPAEGDRHEDATQVVPLAPREDLLAAMDQPRRRKVRRALEAGFRLEVVHPVTAADVPRFFPLYAARAAGWADRRWARDQAYFEALLATAGERFALFLAWAEDGTLAGFQLLGLHGGQATAIWLATEPLHEARQVGAFLAIEPMAWCHARGHMRYDLMASGQLTAVKAYKRSLGAVDAPFAAARVEGPAARAIGAARTLVASVRIPRVELPSLLPA